MPSTLALRPTCSLFVMMALAAALGGCSKSHDLMARVNELADAGLAAPDGDQGSANADAGDNADGIASGQPGASGSGLPGSGNTGSGGRAQSGGTGGSGNTAGQPAQGTGGTMSSGSVAACSPCADAMSMLGTAPACCTADNKCGVDISGLTGAQGGGQGGGRGGGRGGQPTGGAQCLQQNAPGTLDTSCPAYDFMGIFMIPGCCKANKTCGVMVRMLAPVGCVEPTDLFGGRPAPAVPCG